MLISLMIGLLGSPAFAEDVEEEAPKYLLGDLGVRVDLPSGWKVTRWSDWDFKAETSTPGVLLFAWSTPFQIQPSAETLDSWGAIALAKAREIKGQAPEVTHSELGSLNGTPIVMSEVKFHFDSDTGPAGWLYGAVVPVNGQMFHLATVASASRKSRAKRQRDELVKRLDIRSPAAELGWGARVSASGVQTVLPKDWRPPLEIEESFLAAQYKLLGVTDMDSCWTAVRPHPTQDPSLMVTCPGSLFLGLVDEHSFEGADVLVREGLFGTAPVAAGRKLELSDRLAFVYQPPLGERQFMMGAVPYETGIARTWVMGPAGSAPLMSSLEQAIRGSHYEGAHPVGAIDYISYALKYRLLLVLLPLVLFGALILGAAGLFWSKSRKPTFSEFDEELTG